MKHSSFAICLKLVLCPRHLPTLADLKFSGPFKVSLTIQSTIISERWLCVSYLQLVWSVQGAAGVWVPQHWLPNNWIACSQLQALEGEASFFAGSFIIVNFTWISFFMLGPPFIAYPASETDISGWTLKVDINFLLGVFLSLMCLTAEIQEKCHISMHSVVFFGITICSIFLLDRLRYVCFFTKLWNSGDHEIYVPGWLANNMWSILFASLFGGLMRMGKGVSISS